VFLLSILRVYIVYFLYDFHTTTTTTTTTTNNNNCCWRHVLTLAYPDKRPTELCCL